MTKPSLASSASAAWTACAKAACCKSLESAVRNFQTQLSIQSYNSMYSTLQKNTSKVNISWFIALLTNTANWPAHNTCSPLAGRMSHVDLPIPARIFMLRARDSKGGKKPAVVNTIQPIEKHPLRPRLNLLLDIFKALLHLMHLEEVQQCWRCRSTAFETTK